MTDHNHFIIDLISVKDLRRYKIQDETRHDKLRNSSSRFNGATVAINNDDASNAERRMCVYYIRYLVARRNICSNGEIRAKLIAV